MIAQSAQLRAAHGVVAFPIIEYGLCCFGCFQGRVNVGQPQAFRESRPISHQVARGRRHSEN